MGCWLDADTFERDVQRMSFACENCVNKGQPCVRVDLASPNFMEDSQFWVLPVKGKEIYMQKRDY